jgi:3-phosphoglycerate kinase
VQVIFIVGIIEGIFLENLRFHLEEEGNMFKAFRSDCVGKQVEMTCADSASGTVILLENVRFHIEEEDNYVDLEGINRNTAFGIEHRARCSMPCEGFNVKGSGDISSKELVAFVKASDLSASSKRVLMSNCVGEEFEKTCAVSAPDTVILLKNVRFHMEEEDMYVDLEGIYCHIAIGIVHAHGAPCNARASTLSALVTSRLRSSMPSSRPCTCRQNWLSMACACSQATASVRSLRRLALTRRSAP